MTDSAKTPWYQDRRKVLMAALAVLAVIVLVLGLTLSWFVAGQSVSTVGKVQEPKELRVLGPNATAIEQIDMSYTSDDVDPEGNVTLWRPFCVKSDGKPFELQLANTTNIKDLKIEVYRVDAQATKAGSVGPLVSGTVFGQQYSWTATGDPIQFAFINKNEATALADAPLPSNDPTFGDYAGKTGTGGVQDNAAPLYRWAAFGESGYPLDQADGKNADVTNFLLKLSWKESQKETDILYLIARSVSTSDSSAN